MVLQTLKENPVIIGLLIVVTLSGIAVGVTMSISDINPDPPQENNTTEINTVNTTELIESHKNAVTSHEKQQTTVAVYRNNSTAYYEDNKLSQTTLKTFTQATNTETTEIWSNTSNQTTLLYNYDTEEIREINSINTEEKRTKATLLTNILNSGEFTYTNKSITGDSTFILTNLTDTTKLQMALPAVAHRTNATLTDVHINGTITNGHISRLEGNFNSTTTYQQSTSSSGNETETIEKTTAYRFIITTTVNKDINIEKPSWAIEYQTSNPQPNNTTTLNTTTTTSQTEA